MALNHAGGDYVCDSDELTPEERAEIELDPDADADNDMYVVGAP